MTVRKGKAATLILPLLALVLLLLQAAPVFGITTPWGADDTSLQNYTDPYSPDWMAKLKDDTLISKLSIPGTHDSLSTHPELVEGVAPNYQPVCNSLPLMDQLYAGIRLIDIRCRYDESDPDPRTFIRIYHGAVDQQAQFNRDVLDVCELFLAEHPSETIFMRVQQTGGWDFQTIVPTYVQRNPAFWTKFKQAVDSDLGSDMVRWDGTYNDGSDIFSKIPTLGDVRGKIVIMQEFTPSETRPALPLGLEYTNGGLFDLQTGDYYTFGINEVQQKFIDFINHAKDANSSDNRKIVATCFAGGNLAELSTPKQVALGFDSTVWGMNERLYVYLAPPDLTPDICLGMIYLDFPGPGLIKQIIDLNFRKPVITLLGKSEMVLECGVDTFHDPGATVKDDFDSHVNLVVGGDAVDPKKPGIYTITYNAADSFGREADQLTRTVIVRDTLPPEFKSLSATPDLLWPPNDKLVRVNFHADVVDSCDSQPGVVLTAVSSNEPDDNLPGANGRKKKDIRGADIGTPDFSILLRAARLENGKSRTYRVTYAATDHCGNRAAGETTVTVPRIPEKMHSGSRYRHAGFLHPSHGG